MKEVDFKIIDLRKAGLIAEEIAKELGYSVSSIRKKLSIFVKAGLVEKYPMGRRKMEDGGKGNPDSMKGPRRTKLSRRTPENLGCLCEYPSCRMKAAFTFSLVPLCPGHFETLTDETELYYSCEEVKPPTRKHWLMIAGRSKELWRNQRESTSTQTKSAMSQLSSKQRKRTKKAQQ